ncbi:MAG: LysR family transcriptional regulator [Planctomycetota bacterium]
MASPDPESLRCFLEAARRLNFREAAQAVHLTPAALGKRIQQLERELGVELFLRTTRRVELTTAGLSLVEPARVALAAGEACVRAARGEGGPAPLELVLGTRHELGMSWILPMLGKLERALPHLTLHLYVSSGPDLELRVRGSEIDCAVSSRQVSDPKLDALPLHQEDYAFVAAPKALARHPLSRAAHALEHTLIDAHRSLPLFGYWQSAAPERVRFGRVLVMGTIAAIRWLVVRGRGVAVLPRYQVAPDLAAGRLVEVFTKVTPRADTFRLLFRAEDPRIAVFQELARHMRAQPLR